MALTRMERFEGAKVDYTATAMAGTVWLSGRDQYRPVAPGVKAHFDGDNSTWQNINGQLAKLGVGGTSSPDPRVAALEAKLAKARVDAQALANSL